LSKRIDLEMDPSGTTLPAIRPAIRKGRENRAHFLKQIRSGFLSDGRVSEGKEMIARITFVARYWPADDVRQRLSGESNVSQADGGVWESAI